jgi:hypothetical protein
MAQRKKIRRLNRRCAVCGRSLKITVYQDRHYRNGHYFNTLKVPVGKGEHKKVGTSKLFGKKVDIVKWTGKEKEVEYWECAGCFEEASHESWLEELLEKLYGKKCKDYETSCACCQAWSVYETIIDYNRGRL